MPNGIKGLIALLVALPLPSQADSISFEQAWQLLQQNNHSLSAQKENVNRQAYLQQATDNLNYPQISISANYTRLDDDVTINGQQFADSLSGIDGATLAAINSLLPGLGGITSTIEDKDIFTSSIRAIWPIFTGGRISAAQAAAEGRKNEAESMLAMETQARYEDLSKYYFSVVLAQRVVETRTAAVQGLKQHYNNAIKLEQQGQIARVEKLQAQVSYDNAVIELNKAQRSQRIAQMALTQILGQTEPVSPTGELFINAALPQLSTFKQQTLTTYPGLSLLDAKNKQAESLLKAEQGRYYPEVYAYGDYNLYEGDSLAAQVAPDWLVGIGVSIPLVESSGRSEQVKAAKSAIYQVQYLKQQAKQDLSILVEKTYLEAEQAREEVEGLESSITLAKENLRLREKAFAQGLGRSIDVVDAQLYIAAIQTQQSAASFQYLQSLTKLLALSNQMNSFASYQYNGLSTPFTHTKDSQ
ncbi:TolC family protein [Vibrio hippocampi]|uniref:TolC family protein n=1 Tax=Vibrio hippocampi TaxID=654686 RepID=A0ABM8ZH80_9VIBR|nr:TolC family protein [Vibrio hippocampi]CAH0526039.1 hypothetical protein VHP8226_01525 [Vibrio hippocampi]